MTLGLGHLILGNSRMSCFIRKPENTQSKAGMEQVNVRASLQRFYWPNMTILSSE